jgi:hypothetical protein
MTGWTGPVAMLPGRPHGTGTALRPSTDSAYGDAPLKKADTAMYEDEDDDRFEAALRLAEDDPARGAEALRSIAADAAFDPDTRFEAAARLAEVGG